MCIGQIIISYLYCFYDKNYIQLEDICIELIISVGTFTTNLFSIISYLYSFCNKNCIQPEDDHSRIGRNM